MTRLHRLRIVAGHVPNCIFTRSISELTVSLEPAYDEPVVGGTGIEPVTSAL